MWNYSHREFQILPLEPLRARSTKNLDPFIVGVLDPLLGSLMEKNIFDEFRHPQILKKRKNCLRNGWLS